MITENEIQCPHCEYVHEDWWEYLETADQEGEFKMECEDCDECFSVSFSTTVNFTTSKK